MTCGVLSCGICQATTICKTARMLTSPSAKAACLRNDLQRLRAYSGRGSPSGFILHVIENLVIDYVRTILPRRRLPAAIQRLSTLDQSVFRLHYWERLSPDLPVLLTRLPRAETPFSVADVAEALARIRIGASRSISKRRGTAWSQTVDISAADDGVLAGGAEDFAVPTPEDKLLEEQAAGLLEQALAALQHALPRLDANERLYLEFADFVVKVVCWLGEDCD